ncbi:hypothetical protein PC113_g16905 [Phytophthora cactorum]|uniref:Reverse transcriptase Ty1/copia-type domain-containing protein n=1 Tax=Phytophthora cactorum TaxID=29920 RepID=A0A8T0YD06_9STRA|nr:hypothetical protein PC113_g16905 [Phytophthora cactorum]
MHAYLVQLKFTQCVFDAGVYYRQGAYGMIYLTVYVDDIVIAAKPMDIQVVVQELGAKFALKDLGRVKHLLGMEINFIPGVIACLSQTACVERLATRFNMQNMKGVRSPQQHNERMPTTETNKARINSNKLPYRELIGSLQYVVACSRPDMACVVCALGRYNGAYTKDNYKMAQRAVRYMLNTNHVGLVYRPVERLLTLDAFSDADHAMYRDTSRSNTGFVLQLQGLTWMWRSKQQGRVTKNTCASELLLSELVRGQGLSTVYCDNQSTIQVIASRGNSKRVQRYAKEARMIAEFVDDGVVDVKYVSTTENVADILTKTLGPQRFEYLRRKLSMENVHSALVNMQEELEKVD